MTAATLKRRRAALIPEVVQTSATDCGPACLIAAFGGYGAHLDYGRLREACQTDVDGTSIDTIEELAQQLGMPAEQLILPADHLVLDAAEALPAIAVVTQADGSPHFVVVWRRLGAWVQVMDPGHGRRWMHRRELERWLYVHRMAVGIEDWAEWAASDTFSNALLERLRTLGVRRCESLVERALRDVTGGATAALDAAARMVQALVTAGGLRRGNEADAAVRDLTARVEAGDRDAISDAHWSARAQDDGDVEVRGAVVVHLSGADGADADGDGDGDPSIDDGAVEPTPEIDAVVLDRSPRPGQLVLDLVRAEGIAAIGALLLALLLLTVGEVVEILLYRNLIGIETELATAEQRWYAAGALLALLGCMVTLELFAVQGALRLGRNMEIRLRMRFLRKIPRLAVRYFRSRPVSDMADRGHALHHVREAAWLGVHTSRRVLEAVMLGVGLVLIAGASPVLSIALALSAALMPFAISRFLAERELRKRTHAGALARFYLDAMVGAVPLRTHGLARALRRAHEELLVRWREAALSTRRAITGQFAVQQTVTFGLAAWLVVDYVRADSSITGVLLVAYWALRMPEVGLSIANGILEYPKAHNRVLRAAEPLGAREDEPADGAADDRRGATGGVRIELDGVTVRAGGHLVLDDVDLAVAAGEHVAIVGASGAGKSSLLGVLLGWHRPSEGRVLIDDEPLTGGSIERLRAQTAWVDPAVQLWNRPLLDNLRYGAEAGTAPPDPAWVVQSAELAPLLESLPEGMQSALGESGGRVSGGEGQRVRLARAMHRPGARLVLLDEPFRGLDATARRRLLARAREYWGNATLLCAMHDIADTRDFDRVIVVDGGEVVEDGAPAQLLLDASSHYSRLSAAERTVAGLWRGDRWRHLRMERGVLRDGTDEVET